YLEKTIGRSGLPIPFDEIVVIRGQSMDERKKTGQRFKDAFPDSEEIERLLEYTARLNELLIGDSRSSASTKEIERLRDKALRRLDDLEKKNSLAVIAEVRAKLASERPVTVLKSNGAVIGAVSDGQIHGLSLDPVTYGSKGFWCRDAKSVSGGWHHSLGMMSLDMCSDKKAYPSFNSVEGHCKAPMNFQYYGQQGPRPMKTPTRATGTAR
ncbi:MAG: hypothetical protein U1E10_15870, partial [Bdellovibrionales bacterium]|nr:hypothetical protein [Bdellovibrionales bacterium]